MGVLATSGLGQEVVRKPLDQMHLDISPWSLGCRDCSFLAAAGSNAMFSS